ncbi:ABC transporter substrate-binding protein [Paenibacillus flagellatus]|uniref:ABC transporter substrate-binding protein n=1 Tax=Paenibacillus flagellatus TaxID=2211139 RepID=A0A2V5K3D2_9BACL|nr:extracellular solute-binding protein [Paenibacillus flagellatus]PYI52113.1 ABC transporter substrate-binding protein [Paenibacillus flagellatus]
MKARKWAIGGLSVLMACGLAVGCGKSEPNGAAGGQASPNAGGAASPGKTVLLKMWGGVPAESGPQAVVDAWNKQNPDIQVTYERFVNDDAGNLKLDTALMTGQDVDLYVNYTMPRLQKRKESGAALDLSAFPDYSIDEKMGPDAKLWQIDGRYYGMPTKKNLSFVWLNKDALDEAGLPVPPLDWTWDDMRSYAAKLKKDKRWGLLVHESSYMGHVDAATAAVGYTKPDGTSNLNHPLAAKGFEVMYDMMTKDKSMPTYGEQVTSKMPTDTMFLKGEAAILYAGEFIFRSSNNLKDNPRSFKIAFATLPRLSANENEFKYPSGLGDVVSINPKSANKEAAWKFLKWYADGGMTPLAVGGRLPSSKDVNADEAIKLLLSGAESTYDQESLKKVVFGKFPTYQTTLEQQVIDIRKEEYEKYLLGKQDLKTSLDNMAKRHNDFIKQNKK